MRMCKVPTILAFTYTIPTFGNKHNQAYGLATIETLSGKVIKKRYEVFSKITIEGITYEVLNSASLWSPRLYLEPR